MFLMFRKLLNPHYERKITMISRCLLLACVFDPRHATPGYNLDAIRRLTDVNLKLILHIEKYQFIESQ